jgi:hypothetical protein
MKECISRLSSRWSLSETSPPPGQSATGVADEVPVILLDQKVIKEQLPPQNVG